MPARWTVQSAAPGEEPERGDGVNRAALLVGDLGPSGLQSPRQQLAQWVAMGQQCLLEVIFKISGDNFVYDNGPDGAPGI